MPKALTCYVQELHALTDAPRGMQNDCLERDRVGCCQSRVNALQGSDRIVRSTNMEFECRGRNRIDASVQFDELQAPRDR